MSDDAALFAIESWLRRSNFEFPTQHERERAAVLILRRMRLEKMQQQNARFFEHRAIPRRLCDERY